MEAKPGRLVKAVYDFPTDDPSELPLLVGDIIQVKERIDKQWSRGVCANREGNFPIGFTIDVKAPQISENQQLFAAISDFIAQEDGDLTLQKGDLVIGNNPIDSNWWNGEKEDGSHGIFPVTHVWKVDKSILPQTSTNKKMFARGRVKMNMTAQLPEEMDLYKDEIVNIIEEVEKGWYRGTCNGRQGIFPSSFVTVLSESSAENFLDPSTENPPTSHLETYDSNKYGYDCVNSGITPYGYALYPFLAEYANELSLKDGEIVNLIRHVDNNWVEGEIDGKTGMFPTSFINIIVDCPKTDMKESEANNSSNGMDVSVFPADTYGRVICDFYPQLEGDVRLKEGDTVTLIRKINNDWYEVETDNGDTGICPESYIEVIGSGPPSYSEVMASINSSLFDSNVSFTEDSKNASKSSRPLSFASSASDSSFSSQNSASDRSYANISQTVLDDKTSDSVSGFDSLLMSNSSFNSDKPTTINYNFSENRSSQGMDLFSSPGNTTSRNYSFDSPTLSPKPSDRIQNNTTKTWGEGEISNQIQMKEQMIKQRIGCITKLENESKNAYNSSVSSEIRTQISQLNEDVERLKKEIETLKSNQKPDLNQTVSDQSSETEHRLRDEEVARKKEAEQKRRDKEKINKMKEQRDCIITEVLQTEKDYVSDLKLLYDTFLKYPEEAKNKGINVMTLFGNLDEVINVADRLLRRLQKIAMNNQLIGECFVDMHEEMREVYGHYCRNHDEASSILDKIDPKSTAGQFLNHKVEIIQRQTNCFDLGAMLIKPVQRILKYPLLLDQLHKCTEDSHPDKEGLRQAIGIMSDVATAINEFKRAKDLVFKYRKTSDTSLSGRISKFNLHTMAKKSARLGMRLSSSIGLKTVVVDQDFEAIVKKFRALEKNLKIFLNDLGVYSKKAEELYTCSFNVAEGIAELYQERRSQQEVDQFRTAHRVILTQYWESFKQTLDRSINSPIKQLLLAYRGPGNLIVKRNDKLLDFELASSRMEKNKDATKIKMLQEAQQMAKNNYEALNTQLLADLPKLCDLSVEILCDCIRCFLKAKKYFVGRTAKHMIGLMDLPLMLGSEGTGVIETFEVKHNLVMDDLSRLSIAFKQFQSCLKTDTLKKSASPKGSRLSFGQASPAVKLQTPAQKVKIKSIFQESALYTACENFDAVDICDISLKKGDLVGVIKQQDPMGKRTRWFVDNGDIRGLVPAKCLMKFLPDSASGSSWGNFTPSTSTTDTASGVTSNMQTLHPTPQKTVPIAQPQPQAKQNGVIQPTRPAPPVTASLRMVAPSRYPPTSQTSKPKESTSVSNSQRTNTLNIPLNTNVHSSPNVSPNLNINCNTVGNEPVHKYEEIPDTYQNLGDQNTSLMLLGDTTTSSTTASSTSNILDEFDPYSTAKVPEVYDNVPDNLNSMYNSHRYEDIPEDSYYDQVPTEASKTEDEYFFALYDFTPTGPNQLSLRKGQVVLVLHKCDLNQNSEWWFVEDRHGKKGYVPSVYLNKYSKDIA